LSKGGEGDDEEESAEMGCSLQERIESSSPLQKGNIRGFGGPREAVLSYNGDLKGASRQLRNNMTEAERLFWSRVKGKQLSGAQFYRQKIIGNYIVDFYCPQAKLVVEIDGGQHYEEAGAKNDAIRDDCLRAIGLRVLRLSNREVVENVVGVLETVREEIPLNPPLSKRDWGGVGDRGG
jgi:very-short-patch-repair endonuclease